MDELRFLKSCSNDLPSTANNKDAIMKLLQQIVSSQSHFVIQGSPSTAATATDQNSITTTSKTDEITPIDTVRLLTSILKNNNTRIDSLCKLLFFLFDNVYIANRYLSFVASMKYYY